MPTASMPVRQIPAIDLAPFLADDPAGRRMVADAVAAACRDVGFLVISGHGVPQAVRVYRAELAVRWLAE